eukprot:6401883-Pyramimonas_sp.AAC.1
MDFSHFYSSCRRARGYVAGHIKRVQTRLVRLPKASGGHRLVALINTIVRIWARLRIPISRRWERDNQNPDLWGARPAAASSDQLFHTTCKQKLHDTKDTRQ